MTVHSTIAGSFDVTTTLYTHSSALDHDMGVGHPERPDRLRAVARALSAETFARLERREAPQGSSEPICRVHPRAYFEALQAAAPTTGQVQLDGDTAMNWGTWAAVLHAAGGACQATRDVMTGATQNAFVAMRPPGHHAETSTPMGFCFFNNAAIAARTAQAECGAERVAIIDFDVHHGNGTQEIFWADPSVLYASTHQMPLYPGTGARSETGEHDTIINAPLRAGDAGEAFADAVRTVILPRIDAFGPDLIIISAGFDAHRRDPLAQLRLGEDDFAWITGELMTMATRHCGGRIVSLLEGGYDLEGLAGSVSAHVETLMGA
ncbi:MAG: histone deacetylase family protein [Hyphomicrobiales bacterium]|nr:histone deacetylase family protein [Hyphomicrobiales bacterium]